MCDGSAGASALSIHSHSLMEQFCAVKHRTLLHQKRTTCPSTDINLKLITLWQDLSFLKKNCEKNLRDGSC